MIQSVGFDSACSLGMLVACQDRAPSPALRLDSSLIRDAVVSAAYAETLPVCDT